MNVEKLFKIARMIKSEIDATQSLANLGNINSSLTTLVGNPQPQYINQFNQYVVNFRSGFNSSKYDMFGSVDKQLINDLGISELIGTPLLDKVDEILQSNTITYQIAQSEIAPIQQRLNELYNGLTEIIQGFSILKIKEDSQETEFAAVIPRKYTDENLESLGKEIKELNFILHPFYELNGATQADIRVNTIASSDYTVYVSLIPSVAVSIAVAVDKILEWFERIIAIKKSLQELRDNEVQPELIEPILKKKREEVNELISHLADKLIEGKPNLNQHRKQEIKTALKKSIKKMAERIDNGFSYELNVADEAPDDSADEQIEAWKEVRKVSSKLRITAIEGQGILKISYDETETTENPAKRAK